MAARNHIELIEKTFSVLEAIADSENGVTLSALAASCGLVKSSTFRILFTLSALGYVEKIDSTGAYRGTPRLLGLARSPSRRGSLINIARPKLVEVCKKLHESAWLAEWRNGSVIMIDVAEDSHPLQLYLNVGDVCPLHASALGKAIAAHLSAQELRTVLGSGKLVRYTEKTLTGRQELRAHLAEVRQQGYSANEEETIRGALAIAAPIFDWAGKPFAAVSVTAPTARCSLTKRAAIVSEVKRAGADISADLARIRYVSNFRPTVADSGQARGG